MANNFKVITVVAPSYLKEKTKNDFKEWFSKLGKENMVVLFDEDGMFAKQLGIMAFPTPYTLGQIKF